VAYEARTGKPLWHTRIGNISNAPETYMIGGRQYVLVATGDLLWAFVLY
jgi:alcohol dehydrogenase (cytochrome c)